MNSSSTYSESFKLSVVRELESTFCTKKSIARRYGIKGHATILRWLRKYGNGSYEQNKGAIQMSSNPNLENEIKELKRELEDARIKNIVLETLIDVADSELGTNLRKKCGAKPAQK